MRFWDSSAVVPLLVAEDLSAPLQDLYAQDGSAVVWWATPVECVSAVARLSAAAQREGFPVLGRVQLSGATQ